MERHNVKSNSSEAKKKNLDGGGMVMENAANSGEGG